MKIKLIFPPQWSPTQPYLSLPSLVACLKKNGYNVNQQDINLESYDILLSSEYLNKIQERILFGWKSLESKDILLPKYQEEYFQKFQATLVTPDIIDKIDKAKSILRDPEIFYNFELYLDSIITIEKAFEVVSAAYYPTKITLSEFEINSTLLTETDLLTAIKDEEKNPFILLYKDYFLNDIIKENPDVIGISIIGISQLVPGLTLARLIKLNHPEVHINLGGSIFTRLLDKIIGWTEIFGNIFDSVIVYEGETPFLKLCRCLSEGQDLSIVPNLVYKRDGKIFFNEVCKPERIDLLPTPSFDGLPLDQYFSPHPILPILSSRGCYWSRCAFCDHGEIYGSRYDHRRIDLLIEDLQNLSNKHSTKFFTFNDEAIAPNRLKSISDAIILNNLEVKSNANIRLESQFTRDYFHSAFRAGFLSLLFGLESGNDRVLAHMCKGINSQTAKTNFQNSSDAGIWNHAFLFFGFPTETEIEASQTIDFIFSNKDIIHSVGNSTFVLGCCSRVKKNPDMFGVTSIYKDKKAVLDLWFSYSVSKGLTNKQAEEISLEFQKRIEREYCNLGGILCREHLLLYLAYYGKKNLLHMFKETWHPEKLQVGLDVRINKTFIPKFKSGILCGAARFDVAKILAKGKNRNSLFSDNFVILLDLENGKIYSINPSAATIIAYCDGKRSLTEIADIISKKYNNNIDDIIIYCIKFIESMIKTGLCNIKR